MRIAKSSIPFRLSWANGCNNIPEVELACLSSSDDDIDYPSSISVYPNPATDYIIVENRIKENAKINIRDINGRIVLQLSNTDEPINIVSLVPGMYIIDVDLKMIKFVISR